MEGVNTLQAIKTVWKKNIEEQMTPLIKILITKVRAMHWQT